MKTGEQRFSIIEHYRKLWFFNFNRLKGDNYRLMREYFASLFLSEIGDYIDLKGKKALDVGGARGEFCEILSEKAGCKAVNLDPAPYEYGKYESSFLWPDTVIGTADNMPFNDSEFDIVICRGVFEHIYPELQQKSIGEMYRVTKEGGICYITVAPWYSPWAGHGLKPFHYLPFGAAKFLAELFYGKKIEANSWREKRLFRVTCGKMGEMIRTSGFKVLDTKDAHFRLHFNTRIPVIKEVLVPAFVFILKK